jgi:hypothetical protein
MTSCGSCKNRRFGGTHRLHHQGENNQGTRNTLLVALCGVIRSSDTSVLTRATRRHLPEDGTRHVVPLAHAARPTICCDAGLFYSSEALQCLAGLRDAESGARPPSTCVRRICMSQRPSTLATCQGHSRGYSEWRECDEQS